MSPASGATGAQPGDQLRRLLPVLRPGELLSSLLDETLSTRAAQELAEALGQRAWAGRMALHRRR
jgi:hypothetical protein